MTPHNRITLWRQLSLIPILFEIKRERVFVCFFSVNSLLAISVSHNFTLRGSQKVPSRFSYYIPSYKQGFDKKPKISSSVVFFSTRQLLYIRDLMFLTTYFASLKQFFSINWIIFNSANSMIFLRIIMLKLNMHFWTTTRSVKCWSFFDITFEISNF